MSKSFVRRTRVRDVKYFNCRTVRHSARPPNPNRLQCESLTNRSRGHETASVFLEAARRSLRSETNAYQIEIASSPNSFGSGKADIWDSGKSASENSSSRIRWQGIDAKHALLLARHRLGRGRQGVSIERRSLVETGLMDLKKLEAAWIGYEVPERMRCATRMPPWITNADESKRQDRGQFASTIFDVAFELNSAVKHGELFVTGRDSASSWVNGQQVLESDPFAAVEADAVEDVQETRHHSAN